jgi:hypothetical protein
MTNRTYGTDGKVSRRLKAFTVSLVCFLNWPRHSST